MEQHNTCTPHTANIHTTYILAVVFFDLFLYLCRAVVLRLTRDSSRVYRGTNARAVFPSILDTNVELLVPGNGMPYIASYIFIPC